ncbi:MAG: hypothetical protein ACRD0B_01585, partial [Acidimicrobiales bacterium]
LQPIAELVSLGPPGEVVGLCEWARWRFAGPMRPFLAAASPPRIVKQLPSGGTKLAVRREVPKGELSDLVAKALRAGEAILRWPPAAGRLEIVLAALEHLETSAGRSPLVLCESDRDCTVLSSRLRRGGFPVATMPDGWAEALVGGRVVVGTRNAVLQPEGLSGVVVLDAHSEAYRSERAPYLDAAVLAGERARRAKVPCLFVSPCPGVELLHGRTLVVPERSIERRGWATVAVLDARREDPAERGYPSRLVDLVRGSLDRHPAERVVVVLNRSGRARLLSCGICGNVQRCERCGAALVQPARAPRGALGVLSCLRCDTTRPALCLDCGSARLSILRAGVSRAREQLESLLGEPVDEVAGRAGGPSASGADAAPEGSAAVGTEARVIVGTEAVLHRVPRASMVVFLDFDHELLAPRLRAPEQALVLVARAVRLTGDRPGQPVVVLRTSLPDHEVVRAAQRGDPGITAVAESARRALLGLPPEVALATVEGQGADLVAQHLSGAGADKAAHPLELLSSGENRLVLRAPRPEDLCDALAAVAASEPAGWSGMGVRVEVDPVDI